MIRFERPVRFADIDAARMVFFARFCDFCHEALESLFAQLEGGYAQLTMARDIGIPSVHIEFDFRQPLRYGDVVAVEVDVLQIGQRSVTFRHTVKRKSDEAVCAVARHVVVTARISRTESLPVPDDIRRLLARHLIGERKVARGPQT